MRIMDGTSKRKDKNKFKNNIYSYHEDDQENPEEKAKQKRKRVDMRAREEELRRYEEKVFVDYVVESGNIRDKRGFSKDYDKEIRKH